MTRFLCIDWIKGFEVGFEWQYDEQLFVIDLGIIRVWFDYGLN